MSDIYENENQREKFRDSRFNKWFPERYKDSDTLPIKVNPYLQDVKNPKYKNICECFDSHEPIHGFFLEDEIMLKYLIQAIFYIYIRKNKGNIFYYGNSDFFYRVDIDNISDHWYIFESDKFHKIGSILRKHFCKNDLLIIAYTNQGRKSKTVIENINKIIQNRSETNKKTFLCSMEKENFKIEWKEI
ncbi:MAG: hypothetical protein LBG94_03595 [Treponema sp.]|jgi:hypothetical protein|nr:hypothetical protein [Treponema sp.]